MEPTIFDENAKTARRVLKAMSYNIEHQKKEFGLNQFHLTFTKASVSRLPGLSKAVVDKSVTEMEQAGFVFNKKQSGGASIYNLTVEQVISIYQHRGFKPWRETHKGATVLFISSLKGGVSKTVSCVHIAQALRVHPNLLKEDLRVLVIDLDPQSSATMFLNQKLAMGSVDFTAAQAMLNDMDTEDLKENFINKSIVPNVDVMVASIADGFLASDWLSLCKEHLPGRNPNLLLRENIIEKVRDDYDFILVDSGPHLDFFLNNSIAAADVMITPLPPSQVDLHSTLQYVGRLPAIFNRLIDEGVEHLPQHHVAFMTKFSRTPQDIESQSIAKEVFRADMLDAVIPNLSAFQRCGESFDTVISVNPHLYTGDAKALKAAKDAIEDFTIALFNHLNYLRNK